MSFIQRLFSKRGNLEPIDLSLVGADMHSHLIPGIDDGSPNLDATLALLNRFSELGYKKVITTPHVMVDYYRNDSGIILSGLQRVQEAARKAGIPLQIEAAAEYFLDEHFSNLIDNNDILTFGKKYVLFELPFMSEPIMLKSVLFKLQMAGYQPVLAHAERYVFWHKELNKIKDLIDRDVFIQLNINSLTGGYSPQVQKAGETLIDRGWVDFIGSDCHHPGHLESLAQARTLPYLHKVIESGRLKNIELLD
ncbi:MAG: histidinol phosphatase [Flavobacteriales bacterium]|nr:histidinol phosphatase [Flavobacteriales bacterium]